MDSASNIPPSVKKQNRRSFNPVAKMQARQKKALNLSAVSTVSGAQPTPKSNTQIRKDNFADNFKDKNVSQFQPKKHPTGVFNIPVYHTDDQQQAPPFSISTCFAGI